MGVRVRVRASVRACVRRPVRWSLLLGAELMRMDGRRLHVRPSVHCARVRVCTLDCVCVCVVSDGVVLCAAKALICMCDGACRRPNVKSGWLLHRLTYLQGNSKATTGKLAQCLRCLRACAG